MDGLSAAASVFGVVGLAGQIVSGIRTIVDFWSEVQDAPRFIRDALYELQLLSAVSERVQNTSNLREVDPLMLESLKQCAAKVDGFIDFMNELRPSYQASSRRVRTWTAFKAAIRTDRINKFKVEVGETKTTLLLIRQDLAERLQYTFQDQIMSAMASGFSQLKLESQSRTVTTVVHQPTAAENHVQELQSEVRAMTRAMSNPIFRAGYQAGFDEALAKLTASIQTRGGEPNNMITMPSGNNAEKLSPDRFDDAPLLEHGVIESEPTRKRLVGSQMAIARTPLGMFQLQWRKLHVMPASASKEKGEDKSSGYDECHTRLRYHPASWLMRWNLVTSGMQLLTSSSVHGWKNLINTFRAVPDNSAVFEFCRTGNIAGARALLTAGQASPMDTDSLGWTPLHFAAYECNIEMCRLFIDAGADQNALTYDFPKGNYEVCSPLVSASTIQRGSVVTTEERMDVIRLLIKGTEVDFLQNNSEVWKLILVLLERSRPSSSFTNDTRAAKWIFDVFHEEIKEYCPTDNLFWLTLFCVEDPELMAKLIHLRPDAIDLRQTDIGFSVIHNKIAENFPETVLSSFKVLADNGADLHLVGSTPAFGATHATAETPTSLAMRRSVFFDQWRRWLVDIGVDIPSFVEQEMDTGILRYKGWTRGTLQLLFDTPFAPLPMPKIECKICAREVYCLLAMDEMWWENLKSEIRNSSPDGSDSGDDEFFSLDSSAAESLASLKSRKSRRHAERMILCWNCEMMMAVRDPTKRTGSTTYDERVS